MKRRWLALLLPLLALGLWLLWPVPLEEPPPASSEAPSSSSQGEPSSSQARARAFWQGLSGVDLELVVYDSAGQPVPGLALRVEGQEVQTDAEGRARVEGLQRGRSPSVDVDAPWRLVGHLSAPLYASETWTLVVERSCPGSVLLLDGEGQPLPDIALIFRLREETDEEGRAFFAERPCGISELTIDLRLRRMVEIEGQEELVVQLDGPHQGELQLVDPYGEPVDLEVESRLGSLARLERLGPGHYALRSLMKRVGVKWPGGGHRVLLDGSLQVVVVHPLREVGVEVLGLEPESLMCDGEPCEGAGRHWTCSCRHSERSILFIEEP